MTFDYADRVACLSSRQCFGLSNEQAIRAFGLARTRLILDSAEGVVAYLRVNELFIIHKHEQGLKACKQCAFSPLAAQHRWRNLDKGQDSLSLEPKTSSRGTELTNSKRKRAHVLFVSVIHYVKRSGDRYNPQTKVDVQVRHM